jgi:hypothetical protein
MFRSCYLVAQKIDALRWTSMNTSVPKFTFSRLACFLRTVAQSFNSTCPAGCASDVCDSGRCICSPERFGPQCLSTYTACKPTNTSSVCGGRGMCLSGVCSCKYPFVGPNCTSFVGCPANCSGVGTCLAVNATPASQFASRCQCPQGYTGAECEVSTGSATACKIPASSSWRINGSRITAPFTANDLNDSRAYCNYTDLVLQARTKCLFTLPRWIDASSAQGIALEGLRDREPVGYNSTLCTLTIARWMACRWGTTVTPPRPAFSNFVVHQLRPLAQSALCTFGNTGEVVSFRQATRDLVSRVCAKSTAVARPQPAFGWDVVVPTAQPCAVQKAYMVRRHLELGCAGRAAHGLCLAQQFVCLAPVGPLQFANLNSMSFACHLGLLQYGRCYLAAQRDMRVRSRFVGPGGNATALANAALVCRMRTSAALVLGRQFCRSNCTDGTCPPSSERGGCDCPAAFTGPNCNIPVVTCGTNAACSSRGTCVNGACICRAPFTGTDCSAFLGCMRNWCVNGRCAPASDRSAQFFCPPDSHSSNVGLCRAASTPLSVSEFASRCSCPVGFTGVECENDARGATAGLQCPVFTAANSTKWWSASSTIFAGTGATAGVTAVCNLTALRTSLFAACPIEVFPLLLDVPARPLVVAPLNQTRLCTTLIARFVACRYGSFFNSTQAPRTTSPVHSGSTTRICHYKASSEFRFLDLLRSRLLLLTCKAVTTAQSTTYASPTLSCEDVRKNAVRWPAALSACCRLTTNHDARRGHRSGTATSASTRRTFPR